MTDRPIIFSAPMVLALLAGRKTQTRRLAYKGWTAAADGVTVQRATPWQHVARGDRLWVREAWALPSNWNRPASEIAASCREAGYKQPWAPIAYTADGTRDNWGRWREHNPGNSRSPIHMPRWASRLTLTVTDVRMQELLDISDDDAIAEGCVAGKLDDGWGPREIGGGMTIESHGGWCSAAGAFQILWQQLHPDWDGFSSPAVVTLTFTVGRWNIDAMLRGGAPDA